MSARTGPAPRPAAAQDATRPSRRAAGPPFLAVCGPTNLDVLLRVKELPRPGQSTPVVERRVARGGNGSNIAAHAASLGVAVRLWSRVGADFPPAWRADLTALGVDLGHLVQAGTTPTCYVFTDLLDRQSFAIDNGPAFTALPEPSLVQGLAPGAWLHLCAGDPVAFAPLAAAARDAGVRVGLDPGQEMSFRYDRRALEGMLAFADALFVNEAELRVACGLAECSSAEDLLALVPSIVLTRGAHGASLYRRDARTLHAPAFPLDRVADPTGAGDAFRAGWYAALAQGQPPEQALRWGQAAGAAKARHLGSQEHLLTPDDLGRFLAHP